MQITIIFEDEDLRNQFVQSRIDNVLGYYGVSYDTTPKPDLRGRGIFLSADIPGEDFQTFVKELERGHVE